VATIDEALVFREAGRPNLGLMITLGERWTGHRRRRERVGQQRVGIRGPAAAMLADRPARASSSIPARPGGATWADWPDLVDAGLKAEANGYLQLTGIWSH
jgi:hypothetical protein